MPLNRMIANGELNVPELIMIVVEGAAYDVLIGFEAV